ncbi:MAG: hypothetical protein V4616_09890 [Bacteroidota bacterium]
MRILLTALIMCISLVGNAQRFADDWPQIFKSYLGKQYAIQVNYTLYANRLLSSAVQSESSEVSVSGDNYFYRSGQSEVLMNKEHIVILDRKARNIMIGNRTDDGSFSSIAKQNDYMQKMMDVLSQHSFNFEWVDKNKGIARYTCKDKVAGYEQISFDFMVNSKKLLSAWYFFKDPVVTGKGSPPQKPVVKIDFVPSAVKPDFNLNRIVYRRQNKFVPASAFKGYKLIDNTPH